jgi:hypothetical protein
MSGDVRARERANGQQPGETSGAVVEDCVFDRTEPSHAINLFDIDHKYGDVISLRQACEYLRNLENAE